MAEEYNIKVVLLGGSGVGKTSLALRFTQDKFYVSNPPTIVVNSQTKTLTLASGVRIKVNIWDTAGQERYRSITNTYYKDAQAAVLVYDCTRYDSFESMKEWVKELERTVGYKEILLVVAANKCDLVEKEEVDAQEAKYYADSINAKFYLVSAKNGSYINEMFMDICLEIEPDIKVSVEKEKLPKNGTHKLSNSSGKKKTGCC
eukprot:TRINITY_DN1755_c0_g1_i11.p1 TRINITY_DN1755_c0_g1~~TRINITY_DN1755_c0_g1_i11.p1  ORF type:complete len:203 (+),score=66.60 TRINITY_DN1755_c0_g1_i11:157-765(+)